MSQGATSEVSSDAVDTGDVELLNRVRAGDEQAYETLFARHRSAAEAFARGRYGESRADDLVSEAFLRVLMVLRRGGGPDMAFRPYLYVTIRHLAERTGKAASRELATDPQELFMAADEPQVLDRQSAFAESDALRQAFRQLPERWQLALWHSEVENEPQDALAKRLELKPNAVSALTFRAREGLRKAYLSQHIENVSPQCARYVELMPGGIRGELGARQAATLKMHVADCERCTSAHNRLESLNSNLGAVLWPSLVGVAALPQIVPSPRQDSDAVSGSRGAAVGKMAVVLLVLLVSLAGAVAVTGRSDSPGPVVAQPVSTEPTTEAAQPSLALTEPTPTPTTSPSPTASASPTVSASATIAPSSPAPTQASPRPAPSKAPPVPAPTFNSGFGTPTQEPLGTPADWTRVRIPLQGGNSATEVTFALQQVSEYTVVLGGSPDWITCSAGPRTDTGEDTFTVTLTCLVARARNERVVTLDVKPGTKSASLTGDIRPIEGKENDAGDNRLALTVAG